MALDRKRLLKPVKKLRKLVTQLDRRSTPEKVHDPRTKTRQIEATFKALSFDGRAIGTSMLKDLERLRKRAGKGLRSHLKRTPAVLAKRIARNGRGQGQSPAVYAAAVAMKV